jgi:UDP-N-acetylmuramoylalanine--D-glutamate ligase
LNSDFSSIKGLRVTVMGLGLHGGGVESALFFVRHGAAVTVTDLHDEKTLAPSLSRLEGLPIRYVLGKHEKSSFADTDLVIKNPGVPKNSPFLTIASESGIPVETDISVFLTLSHSPLIAVTGSKGKSTAASAIHYCLLTKYRGSRLGGNITVSPLSFIEELAPDEPVVLELSSWQLADLSGRKELKPVIAIITNILPDHMNYYKNMDEYINDKKIIYQNQNGHDFSLFNRNCPSTYTSFNDCKAQTYFFSRQPLMEEREGAWIEGKRGIAVINEQRTVLFGEEIALKGEHNRMNLLCAGLACLLFGLDAKEIHTRLSRFPGIEHRLESFLEHHGVLYVNDSAATIPHATVEAIRAFEPPVFLITGGTDKNIDFSPLLDVIGKCEKIILLAGTATDKIIHLLRKAGIAFEGPYDELEQALEQAISLVYPGVSLLFSPGCSSFGMFLNEFDRGKKFKRVVRNRLGV